MSDSETLLRQNVQALLKERRVPNAALARHLGKTSPWVSQFLNGRRSVPVKLISEIADYLEVPVFRLFQEDPGALSQTRQVENISADRDLLRPPVGVDSASQASEAAYVTSSPSPSTVARTVHAARAAITAIGLQLAELDVTVEDLATAAGLHRGDHPESPAAPAAQTSPRRVHRAARTGSGR